MGKPIRNVTIVGGGTAGWLTASFLRTLLSNSIKITLIESPNVPTVGVGEATVPSMPTTLDMMGIKHQDFFKRCNASFKMGVMFNNWNVDKNGKFIRYLNGFNRPGEIEGVEEAYYYLAYGAGRKDFAQSYAPTVDLIRAYRGPTAITKNPKGQGPQGFAFHLDAGKFAGLLQDVGTARGVEHILADVDDVELDERGYVAALQLRDRGRHEVEFVIDCTGFRGLIINKALGEPFINYSDYLGNNRAMALQIPHSDPDKLESCTSSTALGAGWVWNVPLYNRIGTGYVFSDAHRTDEQARDEFMAHLGDRAPKGAEPRIIPMRIGRSRRTWVKNCLALGLSGGFIEPLESTAIHMIDMGIRWLMTYFPTTDFDDVTRNRYDQVSNAMYDEVLEFISLHYQLGNRTDDPYWIDARTQLKVPDRLVENLELWKTRLPAATDFNRVYLFHHMVYQAVLLGKQVYQQGYAKDGVTMPVKLNKRAWEKHLARMDGLTRDAVKYKADHRTLLTKLRGELPAARQPQFPVAQPTVALPGTSAAKATYKVKLDAIDDSAPGLF